MSDLRNLLINFVISFAASAAFYFLIENYNKSKKATKQDSKQYYDERYVNNIKKEFYICFPIPAIILLMDLFTKSNSFLEIFKALIIFFLLLFSLFSFMCSIDVINSFRKQISSDDSKNNSNKWYEIKSNIYIIQQNWPPF